MAHDRIIRIPKTVFSYKSFFSVSEYSELKQRIIKMCCFEKTGPNYLSLYQP